MLPTKQSLKMDVWNMDIRISMDNRTQKMEDDTPASDVVHRDFIGNSSVHRSTAQERPVTNHSETGGKHLLGM